MFKPYKFKYNNKLYICQGERRHKTLEIAALLGSNGNAENSSRHVNYPYAKQEECSVLCGSFLFLF